MKRLLLPLLAPFFLLILSGCQSNINQWPSNSSSLWSMIKKDSKWSNSNFKEVKPFITVYFKESVEEACEDFEKASKLSYVIQKMERPIYKEYNKDSFNDGLKKQAYLIKELGDKRESKELSTAIEVLRQAGFSDWQLYSRYNSSGVGDKYLKLIKSGTELESISLNIKKYFGNDGVNQARAICNSIGNYSFYEYLPPIYEN